MRLREVQDILRRAIPRLKGIRTDKQAQGLPRIYGLSVADDALAELGRIASLQRRVSDIRKMIPVGFADGLTLHDEVIGPIQAHLQQLGGIAVELLAVVDETLPPQDPASLSIRIPRPESLRELSKIAQDLDEIFDRPARLLFGEGVHFQNLDTGSEWVEIVAASQPVLTFVAGALLTAVLQYSRRKASNKAAAQLLRAGQAVGDSVEAMEEQLESALKIYGRQLAEQAVAAASEPPPRAATNTMIAIEKLSALQFRGAEVVLALNAPAEVQSASPTREAVRLAVGAADSATKLLGVGRGKAE